MLRVEAESRPIDISVEDLPKPEPCLFCGGETKKVDGLEYQVGPTTRKTPGYRCLGCGTEWITPDVGNEILTGRLDFLREQPDNEQGRQEIKATEELIKITRRLI